MIEKICLICNQKFECAYHKRNTCSEKCRYNYRYYFKGINIKKREYHFANRKKILKKMREYHKNNQTYFKNYNQKWRKNNKDWLSNYFKKYDKNRSKIKVNSRQWARNHKLRDNKCSQCSSTKDLHFHHTNYEQNEGFTLCRSCHEQIHHPLEV